jgi:AAA+ superfamily predicted ATPase
MNTTATFNWHYANYLYLRTAVNQVRQAIESQIARLQNQPVEEVPDVQSAPIAAFANLPTPPALDHLCTTFNLSPFERNVLLLCVGMEIDPTFEYLCAKAQGNPQRNYPTFSLALEIFPEFDWSTLTSDAPLRRWQLLEIGSGQALTKCPLRIDECVLHYLTGQPYRDQRLNSLIKPMAAEAYHRTPLQPSHQVLAKELAATWFETADSSTLSIVQLCGSEVASKQAIAAATCTQLGLNLKVMSASRLPTDPGQLNHLTSRWQRQAILTNSTLLLDCDELNTADTARVNAISQLIENTDTALIITTQERLTSLQRPLITFDVPKLTHSEQRAIWEGTLGDAATELNGQVEALVSQFNLSTPAIHAACAGALGRRRALRGDEEPQDQTLSLSTALWDICRAQARPRLDDLAQRIDSTATWDDLVLPEQQRQTLRYMTAHVRQRAKVYEGWGFAGKSGRGLGISALFAGASGTGKTMAAEVVAKELKLDLYRIDLSAVVSKYIGETEKNLRRIFDAAEAGGAVLLFDEADALFGKRTQVKDSHDRHANVEVSYLLQRMEAYQGLAILTTNLKDSLDSAFMRRIRFVVNFPFPDGTGRADIWRRIFPSQTPTEGLDVNKLAKLNVAGGNIRNIALNAAFLAADAGEPVMMKHILAAARSECAKLEKMLTDVEIRGWV